MGIPLGKSLGVWPPPPPDKDTVKRTLLEQWQVQHGGAVWHLLDDVRTCLRCRRTFTGRDVRVEQGRFSKPPEYDLICPTPGCFGSPADWTSLDENSSSLRRCVGDESRGLPGCEVWLRPRYRNDEQEDNMRTVLWDQRPRRKDPLWAKLNPHLTREIVTRCNREVGFVLYTHDGGTTEGIWAPKNPNRPDLLRQRPIPHFHPVTRVEAIGSYYPRKLREFFIVTVEMKALPKIVAKMADGKMQNHIDKLRSRETAWAACQAIGEAIQTHLAANARDVNLDGFTWTVEIRPQAGWLPLHPTAG